MTTTTKAPARIHAKRMESLRQGNQIRTARADLKRRMRVGAADPAAIVREPPEFVASMRVFDLLLAIPMCGPTRTQKIMRALGIGPMKTMAALSERQREAIAREIEAR